MAKVNVLKENGVRRISGLRAKMSDGVELVSDVWFPDTDYKAEWPVLLQRLPYGRNVASTPVIPHPSWLARHGFAVVVQDVRGRGESGGKFDLFLHDADDGLETIEWAARQNFADGNVITYGFSYQGLIQLYAAAQRPPSLRGIAPLMCGVDPYDGWTYESGLRKWEFITYWAAQLAGQEIGVGPVGFDLNALPIRNSLAKNVIPWFDEWLDHPKFDDYWKARTPDISKIDVPIFSIAGWFDDFLTPNLRLINMLHANAVIGPWKHMPWGTRHGDIELGTDSGPTMIADSLILFCQNILEPEAKKTESKIRYKIINGGWETTLKWPPESVSHHWNCLSNGLANSRHGTGVLTQRSNEYELFDVMVSEPLFPFPGFATPLSDESSAEDRRDVCCYTSETLLIDQTIVGSPIVEIETQADVLTYDIIISLTSVISGKSRRVSTGCVRYTNSIIGKANESQIVLTASAFTFLRGTQLRLDISAHRHPQFDRNLQSNQGGDPDALAAEHKVATIFLKKINLTLPIKSPVDTSELTG